MTGNTTLLGTETIRQRIANLECLPPFPAAATQILAECQKPDVDVQAVAQLIECEPAVSSKVIQLANSPLYGASRPIISIKHAIVLLGFKSVSQMAISIAAGSLFQNGDPALALHRKRTFRQSLACAIMSRMIAQQFRTVSPDEAFLCGVMHDVGKLVLFDAAAEEYCAILDEAETDDTTAVEQISFGLDHAGVGKKCGTKWGFPSQINAAIEDHHRRLGETTQELSQAVLAGNYYSRRWMIASDAPPLQQERPEIDNAFKEEELAAMKDECFDQFQAITEICAA